MTSLIWFGNNLRISDNIALNKACSSTSTIAVFCFDPRRFAIDRYGFKRTERFRAQFLIESVTELKSNLKKLNIPLFVFHDQPENCIPRLVTALGIDRIYVQREWTRDEVKVRNGVCAKIPGHVQLQEYYDQFLFHPEDIPFMDYQQIPNVFTVFRKKCEKNIRIRSPLKYPDPKPVNNWIEDRTKVPDLKELGLEPFETDLRTAFPFKGGESNARTRIDHYFWETHRLSQYKKTRNGLIGQDYSSKLSTWLANGSISARTVFWEVKRYEQTVKKNEDTYWLIFELIWRDFFKYISLKYGNRIFQGKGIQDKMYHGRRNQQHKKDWILGTTCASFINANMRELAQTGWMSNRGRQNVASYWAKTLQQDWRLGAAYFESMLIDYDVHSNWGNWMYVSGVGNDPRNRIFNPERQAEIYDSKGKYQELWLQETLF